MRRFETFVAHRYLSTRRKGSAVRVMVALARWGTALGVFCMVVAAALMNGVRDEIQSNLFTATAHFTVFHREDDIPRTQEVLRKIRAMPGVLAASPIRMEQGLLKKADAPGDFLPSREVETLLIKAVEPATAHQTSSIFDSCAGRRVEDLQPGEILVGYEMANNAGLSPGDTVAVSVLRLELGLSGLQPRMMAFKVAGTFQSHISEYDRRWAFIHIADAQALAGSTEAQRIEVRTRNVNRIDDVKASVVEALNADPELQPQEPGGDTRVRVLTRSFAAADLRDTNRSYFAALNLQKVLSTALMGLIVLVSAFNIISILVVMVTEKRRELGVLLSLGARPNQISRIFVLQAVRIGAVGTFWGLVAAIPTCLVLDHWRLIHLPKAFFDFITYLPFRLEFLDLVFIALFPTLVSLLAALYPASKAAAVNPVETLRSE